MFVPPADVSATDIATRNSAGPDQQSFIERKDAAIQKFVIISGCSGGGKSTLLTELGGRGFATVEEPGRRIVREELAGDGSALRSALPWVNAVAFARRAIAMSLADMAAAAPHHGWIFFDRGLIDAAVALEHLCGEPARTTVGVHCFHPRVFLAPPWPDIYVSDDERRHAFDAAIAEYERLREAYPALGYEVVTLPRVAVSARADFILSSLEQPI
jgi:predicted ATPase